MLTLLMLLPGAITVLRTPGFVAVDNGKVRFTVDRLRGEYDIRFRPGPHIRAADSVVRLKDGTALRASSYIVHRVAAASIRDWFGVGERVTVHNHSPNLPELRQEFRIYSGRSEVFVDIEVVGKGELESNYMAPVLAKFTVCKGLVKSLFVPYDNDNYSHYRTDSWATKL